MKSIVCVHAHALAVLLLSVGSASSAVIVRSVQYELTATAFGKSFPDISSSDSDVKVGFPLSFPFNDIAFAQTGGSGIGTGQATFDAITAPGVLQFDAVGAGDGQDFSAGEFSAYGEGVAEFTVRFDVIGSTTISSTLAGYYYKTGSLDKIGFGVLLNSPFGTTILPSGEYLLYPFTN
jgi:hypothetical protein